MSKEDKKIIDKLKETIDFNSTLYIDDLGDNDIKDVLNLIEKQQKEIEELKAITKEYKAFNGAIEDKIIIADDRYFNSGIFKNNYIPKQKLRDLIDNNQDDIDYSIHDIIKDLKELLED